MRTRRSPHISFLFLAVVGVLAAWAGCSASGASHVSGGTGTGTTTLTGSGGAGTGGGGMGGAGGGTDGGADSGPTCPANQKSCNGMCVDVDDPQYGCSDTFCTSCPTYTNGTAACSGGACVLGTCSMGYKNCDGQDGNGCETDISHDPDNCGACGSPCVLAHATPVCNDGTCQVGMCDTGGWTDCSGADGGTPDGGASSIGCTTNTQTDTTNCGGCGMPCPGQQSCHQGTCGLVCGKGFADCDSDPTDCETMLGTDKNCAGCNDCTVPNATTQCNVSGSTNTCAITACDTGWGNCDNIPGNGCETNTNTDPNHCGNCGNPACPAPPGTHSTAVCNIGTCGIVCDPGYADCNHDPSDGCEVDLNGDANNCNACKNACSQNNGTEACMSGKCTIVKCNSGFDDCNKDPSDGCEVNTQQGDVNNCGVCGTICTTKNGTPACSQGACTVGSCNTGFSHCPGKPGTDCETSTATDVNNCGACGNVCSTNNDTPSCTNGACILTCAPLFDNCDGNVTNGCETGLNTIAHCGSCNTTCTTQNGTPACNVSGTTATCGVASCSTGYGNCPGDGNDCKTLTGGSDVNNCGACGKVCPGGGSLNDTAKCTGGTCGFTCNPGFQDCNGNGVDGCEVNINSDANNCGACNSSCLTTCGGSAKHVTGTACSAGACSITACSPFWENTDGTCSDGCECQDTNATNTTCGSATALTINNAVTANLFPASIGSAYYVVTFSGNTSLSFHPTITLTGPAGEFAMDVTTNCSTPITNCPDHSALGITTWETSYVGPSPIADPGTYPVSGTNFAPIPLPGVNGTVYIRVYRVGAMTSCNDSYTLRASQ